MGIADINPFSNEFADKILVLCKESSVRDDILNTLASREYLVSCFDSLPESLDARVDDLWDLVILEPLDLEANLDDLAQTVRANPRLCRATLIILLPGEGDTECISDVTLPIQQQVFVAKTPIDPASFLVKVSTILRLRKKLVESARVSSDLTVQNARLRDLTNRFQHELRQAQSIHQSLLPKSLPSHPKCYFAATYLPLETVGGDMFDIWQLDENKFGIFIGDVTGHGLPAAFLGAMTKMALAYSPKKSPDKILSHMTDGLADYMPEGSFVTAMVVIIDVQKGTLKVAKGGHPPPLLWRANSMDVDSVSPRGLPLGVLKESRYELQEVKIYPGDKILLMTDGLTETMDMNGKMLGTDGVLAMLKEVAPNSNIADCLEAILEKQKDFCEGRLLKDDTTLFGIEMVKSV